MEALSPNLCTKASVMSPLTVSDLGEMETNLNRCDSECGNKEYLATSMDVVAENRGKLGDAGECMKWDDSRIDTGKSNIWKLKIPLIKGLKINWWVLTSLRMLNM
eukprot:TRINITY_DN7815_c0_g1_i17.p3 TRINITY_DN7815_c0_g1~~TRINITY_DN7815_c0_g1_i17.p3  ORF type:complete len:105 (-),score=14.09 TRINITY_DN7815_c0_g1_i17:524-838(-)